MNTMDPLQVGISYICEEEKGGRKKRKRTGTTLLKPTKSV
jgi:hypothetical protein